MKVFWLKQIRQIKILKIQGNNSILSNSRFQQFPLKLKHNRRFAASPNAGDHLDNILVLMKKKPVYKFLSNNAHTLYCNPIFL